MFKHRILLAIFNGQGQINPSFQFAKRVIAMGARVTIPIVASLHRRIANKSPISGLSLVPFSDGHDDGFNPNKTTHADFALYASQLHQRASDFVSHLILSAASDGDPFTCLLYTLLVPWAPPLARRFNLPTAMLWVEPATVLNIIYHYFHGYADHINHASKTTAIVFPGFSFSLSPRDMPSMLLHRESGISSFFYSLFEEQIQQLDLERNLLVLVNTFEALEEEALRAVDKLNMIPIGPLVPSAILDGKDPRDTSFGGDLLPVSSHYLEWLDSKQENSVVYVSFGSYWELSKRQMEEIADALLDCERPFLWVIRRKVVEDGKEEDDISCREELEKKGKIVTGGSVPCFCGLFRDALWLELHHGRTCLRVPMVAFPQFTDQMTNAKLIEDVWKVGVRVEDEDDDGIVEGKEIKRCMEVVMGNGDKGNELRRNAEKWKVEAREAAIEGGSSEKNLKAFLDGVA
ncbi:hypothetical protein Fmac_004780 [Flemingia macrophylla]|uniref:EF-hand domain-containing protein n=1 Tax=Flemingia macrophylla TaxID=520843 RepID=A0ABD1N5Z6_9FABA